MNRIRPQVSAVVLHAFWDDALGGGESPASRPSDGRGIKGEGIHFKHTAVTIAEDPAHTAEAFACLEGILNHAKVPSGGVNDLPDASVPALNPGYETTTDTIARRRAALAGLRLGKKLKVLF